MAALTPTATQLCSGWGCIPVTRGALEDIFGATGGRSINVVKQAQEQTFCPFSLQPTWGLAPGGLWCSHRSQLSWILSARGDTGLGEGQQGQEFGTEKTQRVHASLTALSISKPSCTHPPALHGRSSECPQISQPGDPRNLPPFRLEQLARAQCFP